MDYNIEVSVYKVGVWFIMFEFKACEVLNNNKFTFVNVCFQHKHNAEIGHSGRTLIMYRFLIDDFAKDNIALL